MRQASNLILFKISVDNMSIDLRLFKGFSLKGLISEAEYYRGEEFTAGKWDAIDFPARH
jgi:hypothetical protein